MGKTLDEGLLFDIITKRRAGKFTADEFLWTADHPEIVRWAMANLSIVEDYITGRLVVVKPDGFPTTYDQSVGLRKLIELAVGEYNLANINSNITQDRFPLNGTDVREVNLRVEAYLNGETSEEAAERLVPAGHSLANTGDLAGFLHDHPDEVAKWNWVEAISEDSRWTYPGGSVMVPFACVGGACRCFNLFNFRRQHDCSNGVLVRC